MNEEPKLFPYKDLTPLGMAWQRIDNLTNEIERLKTELDRLTRRWNDDVAKVYDDKNELERKLEKAKNALASIAELPLSNAGYWNVLAYKTLKELEEKA